MAMMKIEKGVPIPATTARSGDNMDLLRSMEVGDSVYFDAPIAHKATRFYRVAKKLNVSVLIRKDGEGMRLWRTAGSEAARVKVDPVAKAKPVAKAPAKKVEPKAAAKKSAAKVAAVKAKPAQPSKKLSPAKVAAIEAKMGDVK